MSFMNPIVKGENRELKVWCMVRQKRSNLKWVYLRCFNLKRERKSSKLQYRMVTVGQMAKLLQLVDYLYK